MPVKTRSTSKKFRDELHNQIIKMYSFKNIGITKCFDIVNRLDLDGHTIRTPNAYIKLGIHPSYINTFVSDHYIYRDSPPVSGIYDLTILYEMNRVFNLQAKSCIGRGTQADYIREAMEKRINEMSK